MTKRNSNLIIMTGWLNDYSWKWIQSEDKINVWNNVPVILPLSNKLKMLRFKIVVIADNHINWIITFSFYVKSRSLSTLPSFQR